MFHVSVCVCTVGTAASVTCLVFVPTAQSNIVFQTAQPTFERESCFDLVHV